MKRIPILFFLFVFLVDASGQGYVSLGYQIGSFSSGLKNLRNEVYYLNHVTYPNFTEKFEMSNFNHGVEIEFGYFDNKWYYFGNWNNKHLVISGSGKNQKGQDTEFSIKVRHNNFVTFAVGRKLKPWLGVAFAPANLGTFKVLKKSNDNPETDEWTDFYPNVTKGILSQYTTLGGSLYVDVFLKRLRLRGSYNFDYFRHEINVGPGYAYPQNSVNLGAAFIIGGR